jgi:hypothetical protein
MGQSDGIGLDPHRDQPRMAPRRKIVDRSNNLAMVFDVGIEQLSALRQELGVRDRLEVQRWKVE